MQAGIILCREKEPLSTCPGCPDRGILHLEDKHALIDQHAKLHDALGSRKLRRCFHSIVQKIHEQGAEVDLFERQL